MKDFFTCFIPIFVAVNAIGILPTFLSLTSDHSHFAKRVIIIQASFTAAAVGIAFLILGKSIFAFLGISISDFRVAGGLLLLLFAVRDLNKGSSKRRTVADNHVGIVPIGLPLIAGPGVLTTIPIMEAQFGFTITLISFLINIFIVYLFFRFSDLVLKTIGRAGALAIGKLFGIFLAAIGVMLIRTGITAFFEQYPL